MSVRTPSRRPHHTLEDQPSLVVSFSIQRAAEDAAFHVGPTPPIANPFSAQQGSELISQQEEENTNITKTHTPRDGF